MIATAGSNVSSTFRLSGYDGLITGWEVSTDPAFAANVKLFYNLADTLVFNDTVNTTTYIRALVQTNGCAITGSKAAVIRTNCGNLVKNGSFENPALPSKTWALKAVPNWTNLVDNNTIEVHRNYLTTASEGSQYIELNGYNAGKIYQDITVAAGKAVNWKLDHRARATGNETITVTLSAPDGTNSQTTTHRASSTAWQAVAGAYNVAASQTMVRMKIVSTTGTNSGNFIDNVSMQYAECSANTAMSASATIAEVNTGNSAVAGIVVSPNPVTANATVDLKGYDDGIVKLIVVSAQGIVLRSVEYNYTQGSRYSLDLSGLANGIYLIKVEQNGKSATTKVLKN